MFYNMFSHWERKSKPPVENYQTIHYFFLMHLCNELIFNNKFDKKVLNSFRNAFIYLLIN
jgi:hypothetical protein